MPATSISILNFWRAWQPNFLSQALQILVSHVSFIDKQMMFSSFVYIFTGFQQFSKNWFSLSQVAPMMHKLCIMGATQNEKSQFFENSWNPIKDINKWWKHHLFVYKKYTFDQNLEGVTQKLRLPRPWEVQNWNGPGRLIFWATASKLCKSS